MIGELFPESSRCSILLGVPESPEQIACLEQNSTIGRTAMAPARPTEAGLLRRTISDLSDLLPPGWTLSPQRVGGGSNAPHLVVRVKGADGVEGAVVVEAKQTLIARDVGRVLERLRAFAERVGVTDASLVVVAPYLSETTREQVSSLGANYIDSTGNILLRTQRPALFIKQGGASKDPWPSDESLRSLRGRGSARAVRALLDLRPPYGLRELAERARVPVGSLSRAVDLLDRDGLITRADRGPITGVQWEGVIRRWARDYDVTTSNVINRFLEPRGLKTLSTKLGTLKSRYAVTGALAAQRFSPVAPTRLAAIYVDDVVAAADQLDLRLADSGANVWLIEPYDEVVFDRTSIRDGTVCVSPTQLAVDLLTGPGRDPAEGEELLLWMKENERDWRT